jgi:hypothetical protein
MQPLFIYETGAYQRGYHDCGYRLAILCLIALAAS